MGPFSVLGALGSGGVATVLAAARETRLLALKRVHEHLAAHEAVRAALRREASLQGLVESAHVVRVDAVVEDGAEIALSMEYVEGVSLAHLLDAAARRGGRLRASVVVRIALDLLDGLSAIHEAQASPGGARLCHADVGPRNLLVGVDGVARLCDFGAAGEERSARGEPFRGSVAYAAPEALAGGDVLVEGDSFSAGVVLWEALRTERLFRGRSEAETIRRVVEEPAPPVDAGRPGLTPLSGVVTATLDKRPARRPPSARALAGALAAAAPEIATRGEVAAAVRALGADELRRRAILLGRGG